MSDYEITYTKTIDPEQFTFWSGAWERMRDATDEQREQVYARLQEYASLKDLTATDINDIVWFECDDIFYPEEE